MAYACDGARGGAVLATALDTCDALKGRICEAVSAGLRPADTVRSGGSPGRCGLPGPGRRLTQGGLQWLACGSRPCRGHLPLQQAGVGPGSLCQLHLRLRGGGGDGGATGAESRVSYLEMYMGKKADKARPTPAAAAARTARRCVLTEPGRCAGGPGRGAPGTLHPLQPVRGAPQPALLCRRAGVVVQQGRGRGGPPRQGGLVCRAPRFWVLAWARQLTPLAAVQSLPVSMSHIASLKHLIDLQLCRSNQSAARAASHREFTANATEFCCPVTGLPFNGSARFMVLPKNGFVVSEKALKQVPRAASLPPCSLVWAIRPLTRIAAGPQPR